MLVFIPPGLLKSVMKKMEEGDSHFDLYAHCGGIASAQVTAVVETRSRSPIRWQPPSSR